MSTTAGASLWPVFRDGRTSTLSYAFLAVKDSPDYNCIVWSPESKKMKFYPNAEFWGVNDSTLASLGLYQSLYSREDYNGLYDIDRHQALRVLDYVWCQRGTTVVNSQMFLDCDFSACDRQKSRKYHPEGSRVSPQQDQLT